MMSLSTVSLSCFSVCRTTAKRVYLSPSTAGVCSSALRKSSNMQPVVLPEPTGPAINLPNAADFMKAATVGGASNLIGASIDTLFKALVEIFVERSIHLQFGRFVIDYLA